MNAMVRSIIALGAAASLAACGGSQTPPGALGANEASNTASGKKIFHYTGAGQTFVVPKGVTVITIVADGASGQGGFSSPSDNTPGFGGRVFAVVPVIPGEKLSVFVGGTASNRSGGFNGGGSAAPKHGFGYGGGGASDVREGGDKLVNRIVVAGGGGGAGGSPIYAYGYGGAGGAKVGGTGGGPSSSIPGGFGGTGGSQRRGGRGGAGGTGKSTGEDGHPGGDGRLGVGGDGGESGTSGSGYNGGGGGGAGGGYYGGGGGGGGASTGRAYGDNIGGGGGGGSSYVEHRATESRMWQGWKKAYGNGVVTIDW